MRAKRKWLNRLFVKSQECSNVVTLRTSSHGTIKIWLSQWFGEPGDLYIEVIGGNIQTIRTKHAKKEKA